MNEASPGQTQSAEAPIAEMPGPETPTGAERAPEAPGQGAPEPAAPEAAEAPAAETEAPRPPENATQLARQRQALIQSQLRQIAELDPEVKSLEDLTRTEQYGQLYALVRRGYTLVDAYKLANFDRLTRRAELAAAQRYRNALDGVRHLTATRSHGAGSPVPADVAAQYRALNPGVSDGEIARHYNRYHH